MLYVLAFFIPKATLLGYYVKDMKTNSLFRLIPLLAVSLFAVGCSNRSSNSGPISNTNISSNQTQSSQTNSTSSPFENIPLTYGIKFDQRNDMVDADTLLTHVSYDCYVETDMNNDLDGEPVFTYDHDLADIVVDDSYRGLSNCYFCLMIKGTESSNFELDIEWRTQKIKKTYAISKVTDLATCLYDYQSNSNQKADYDDFSVVDSQEKYQTLKSSLKNYVNGYKFPEVTFDNSFLLVRYYYVSGYVEYKYNQCFLFKEKLMIDYHEEYSTGDIFMVISGVHFTLLQLPNEYKTSEFKSHHSYVVGLK